MHVELPDNTNVLPTESYSGMMHCQYACESSRLWLAHTQIPLGYDNPNVELSICPRDMLCFIIKWTSICLRPCLTVWSTRYMITIKVSDVCSLTVC